MATYFMFGKYTLDGIKDISVKRTEKASALVKKHGGEIKSVYALLGATDLVFIVDFPGTEQAMKASVELMKLLGVSFTTAPAVTAEEFDQIMG
jgi:uncharacterized protein with GYD domain